MKNNSKSGLKIKQLMIVLPILIVLSINAQLFISNKDIKVASTTIQEEMISENNILEEMQVANADEIETQITVRAGEERTLINNDEEVKLEEQYITIEEIKISKDMDLTKRCGISKEDFKILMTNLKSDTSGFFKENSDTIYDLCEKYEINEIFFCGLIAAESGWNIASNHRNANNYISMMSKGKLIRYSTPEEGLEAAAKLLHNKYLTEGGSCYYGKTLSCVQKRFCPNSSTWVGLVYGCMKQIVK